MKVKQRIFIAVIHGGKITKRFVKKELDTENWSSNGDLCELIDAYGNKKYLHFHKTDTKPIWISDNISVRR